MEHIIEAFFFNFQGLVRGLLCPLDAAAVSNLLHINIFIGNLTKFLKTSLKVA